MVGLIFLSTMQELAHKKRLDETTLQEYNEIMDTNLKGVFLCTKYAIPHIRNSQNGKIINISSGAGLHGIPELSSVLCLKVWSKRHNQIHRL